MPKVHNDGLVDARCADEMFVERAELTLARPLLQGHRQIAPRRVVNNLDGPRLNPIEMGLPPPPSAVRFETAV